MTLNDAEGVLTITDDDDEPSLSVADMITPNETGVERNVTVTLSAASEKQVTVDYTTADGTASSVSDYVSETDQLTFAPGEVEKQISIEIRDDDLEELNEIFTVELSNPVNAMIASSTSTITITDDEGVPTLSIADVSTSDEDPDIITATVTLSGESSQTVTVNYATADGTAEAGNDYTAASDTLTFAPGDLTKTIDVTI